MSCGIVEVDGEANRGISRDRPSLARAEAHNEDIGDDRAAAEGEGGVARSEWRRGPDAAGPELVERDDARRV